MVLELGLGLCGEYDDGVVSDVGETGEGEEEIGEEGDKSEGSKERDSEQEADEEVYGGRVPPASPESRIPKHNLLPLFEGRAGSAFVLFPPVLILGFFCVGTTSMAIWSCSVGLEFVLGFGSALQVVLRGFVIFAFDVVSDNF